MRLVEPLRPGFVALAGDRFSWDWQIVRDTRACSITTVPPLWHQLWSRASFPAHVARQRASLGDRRTHSSAPGVGTSRTPMSRQNTQSTAALARASRWIVHRAAHALRLALRREAHRSEDKRPQAADSVQPQTGSNPSMPRLCADLRGAAAARRAPEGLILSCFCFCMPSLFFANCASGRAE